MLRLTLLACILHTVSFSASAQAACNPNAPLIRLNTSYIGSTIDAELIDTDYDLARNGEIVVFSSSSMEFVPDDTTPYSDIFMFRRQNCSLTRLSVSASGQEGNGQSFEPTVSDDGRYVAFSSRASNLAASDSNNDFDVLVHDTQTGTFTLGSVSSSSEQGNASSYDPQLSGDGRYLVFTSEADNLVAGDTNGVSDVFLRDLLLGVTTRLSLDPADQPFSSLSRIPLLSNNGRFAVFSVDYSFYETEIYLRDIQADQTELVSLTDAGTPIIGEVYTGGVSDDGRFVLLMTFVDNIAGDAPQVTDVFLRDRLHQRTRLLSKYENGELSFDGSAVMPQNALSLEGRVIALISLADLADEDNNAQTDNVLLDQLTGQMYPIPAQGNDGSYYIQMSPDARYAVFASTATNLVPGTFYGVRQLYLARLPAMPLVRTIYATSTPTLTWGSLTWAVRYEVQVDDDPDFTSLKCCVDLVTGTLVQTPPLDNHRIYYWRVRAINAANQPGTWSRVEEFVIDAP